MKKTLKLIAMLLSVTTFTFGNVSCENKEQKQVDNILDKIEVFVDNDMFDSANVYSNRLINCQLTDKQQKRYDVLIRERKRAKQDSIENVMEQNRREEFNSYQEEKPQVNPIEHFARRYIFSDDGIGVEVLPDGRVLQISHIIATGEETKKYIGNISIISDNAFVVKGEVFFPGNTPIYVMRNGSEHGGTWTAKFGNDYYGVVFDISERRIYLGRMNAYENRDISEAEYIKYR